MPDTDNVKVKKEKAGRKRRTLGWTLLALGLLVAGVWVASWRWHLQREQFGGTSIMVYCGGIDIESPFGRTPELPVWRCGVLPDSWRRWRWTAEPQRIQPYRTRRGGTA